MQVQFCSTGLDNNSLIEFKMHFLFLYRLSSKDVMLGAWEHLITLEHHLQLLAFNLVLILYWSLSCQNGRKDIFPSRNPQFGLQMTILEASILEAKRLTSQRKHLFNLERGHRMF